MTEKNQREKKKSHARRPDLNSQPRLDCLKSPITQAL